MAQLLTLWLTRTPIDWITLSLTDSHNIDSITYSVIDWLTHYLTHSLTDWLNHILIDTLNHSSTNCQKQDQQDSSWNFKQNSVIFVIAASVTDCLGTKGKSCNYFVRSRWISFLTFRQQDLKKEKKMALKYLVLRPASQRYLLTGVYSTFIPDLYY